MNDEAVYRTAPATPVLLNINIKDNTRDNPALRTDSRDLADLVYHKDLAYINIERGKKFINYFCIYIILKTIFYLI